MGFQSAFELEIACYAVVVNPPLTYHRAMGIYDREYFRQPARRDSLASVPALSVTMWRSVIYSAVADAHPGKLALRAAGGGVGGNFRRSGGGGDGGPECDDHAAVSAHPDEPQNFRLGAHRHRGIHGLQCRSQRRR